MKTNADVGEENKPGVTHTTAGKETDERRLRFLTLPSEIQNQYHNLPLVHMWVSAYLYDKVSREEMFENLATQLATQHAETIKNLMKWTAWFGGPPMVPNIR